MRNIWNRGMRNIASAKDANEKSIEKIKKLRIIVIIFIVVFIFTAFALGFFQLQKLLPQNNINSQQNAGDSSGIISASDRLKEKELTYVSTDIPLANDYVPRLCDYSNGIKVDSMIKQELDKMIKDIKSAGYNLVVTQGYVDKDQQQAKHQQLVEHYMSEGYTQVRAKAEASKRIPQGNYSDYQTGLSVDIAKQNAPADEDFSATTEFRYLSSVCVNYGFVLRYPRFKEDKTKMDFIPNQFRYVGKDNALKMRTFEMCMDEYIYYLKAQKS